MMLGYKEELEGALINDGLGTQSDTEKSVKRVIPSEIGDRAICRA